MATYREYERADGSTFIVGPCGVAGRYCVIGHAEHYRTRHEAVAAGMAMTAAPADAH